MVAAFTDHVTLIQEPDEGACAVGLVLHSSTAVNIISRADRGVHPMPGLRSAVATLETETCSDSRFLNVQ